MSTYSQENKEKPFWPWARVTKTIQRWGPGAKKYRQKYDLMFGKEKFRTVRHYKSENGKRKITVEIEVFSN